jgi:hypothetical protein
MKTPRRPITMAGLLALVALAGCGAPEDAADPREAARGGRPPLGAAELDALVDCLRTGTENESAAEANERIVAMGVEVTPRIVEWLSKSRDPLQQRRCVGILVRLGPAALSAAVPWLERRAAADPVDPDPLGLACAEALAMLRARPSADAAPPEWEEWWRENGLPR